MSCPSVSAASSERSILTRGIVRSFHVGISLSAAPDAKPGDLDAQARARAVQSGRRCYRGNTGTGIGVAPPATPSPILAIGHYRIDEISSSGSNIFPFLNTR